MKESQAARYADLLEGIVGKARALTVERLAKGITVTALGLGAAVVILVAFVLAAIGLFRLVAIWVGATGAYAIFGALSIVAGWFSWRRRIHAPEESDG